MLHSPSMKLRRPRLNLAWLLALCAGFGEFAGLQAWRLRDRLARR